MPAEVAPQSAITTTTATQRLLWAATDMAAALAPLAVSAPLAASEATHSSPLVEAAASSPSSSPWYVICANHLTPLMWGWMCCESTFHLHCFLRLQSRLVVGGLWHSGVSRGCSGFFHLYRICAAFSCDFRNTTHRLRQLMDTHIPPALFAMPSCICSFRLSFRRAWS